MERIVCALDLRRGASPAASRADALARNSGARVCFLGYSPCGLVRHGASLIGGLGDARRALAAATGRSFLDVPLVPAGGESEVEVLRTARMLHADLVVLDAPRVSGIRRWLPGSRVRSAMRGADGALLFERAARRGGPVLAATNLAVPEFPVVAWGAWMCRALHAPLILLHTLATDIPVRWDAMTGMPLNTGSFVAECLREARASAESRLRDAQARCNAQGELCVADGSPVETILATASRVDADVVVVGSDAVRGIVRRLRGTVGERVARRAPCSVLAVPIGRS